MNKQINTDTSPKGEARLTQMKKKIHADTGLLYEELTYEVRGAIFNVYNELGFGHKEQVYEKALIIELKKLNISYKSQESINVLYKDVVVGKYRPDIIVGEKVVIELKAVEFMPKSYETQLINYLKSTKYKLGLLVNFGTPKLSIKRIILS